jgi:hypothetical protein
MTRGSFSPPYRVQSNQTFDPYGTIYAVPSSSIGGSINQSPARTINYVLPTNNGDGYITPFKRPPLVSKDTEAECVRQSANYYGGLGATGRRLFTEAENESSPRVVPKAVLRAEPRAVEFSQIPEPLVYIGLGEFRYTPNPIPHIPLYIPPDKEQNAKNKNLFGVKRYSEVLHMSHQFGAPQNLSPHPASFSSPPPASSFKAVAWIDSIDPSYFSPQPNSNSIQPEAIKPESQPSEEAKITLKEVDRELVFPENYKPPFYKEVKLEIKKHETIIEKINSFFNKFFNKQDYAKTIEDYKTKALVREYKIAEIATQTDLSKVKVEDYIKNLRNPKENIESFRRTNNTQTNNLYNRINKLEPDFLTKGSITQNHDFRKKLANALELGLQIKEKNNSELNHLINAIGTGYYADSEVGQIAKLAKIMIDDEFKEGKINHSSPPLIISSSSKAPQLINPQSQARVNVSITQGTPSPSAHSPGANILFLQSPPIQIAPFSRQ